MESIDSGTASRFSRGTSVSGMSGVSEEPDLSDLDFLMEDQVRQTSTFELSNFRTFELSNFDIVFDHYFYPSTKGTQEECF